MSRGDEPTGHVFISYVREDAHHIDRLQRSLEAAGVLVWRDTVDLWPGEDWRAKIRRAITDDALVFIACFSKKSLARQRAYQNEELVLAIEQLRRRSAEDSWLIPVRLDECDIPDRDIGAGRTLRSIHHVDLFDDFDKGAERIIGAVSRILGEADRRAMDLANQYALACAAADAEEWDQAVISFTMITDIDPDYRDVQVRADNARKQQLIARLRTEVRRLYQAGQWAAVVRTGKRLHGLDPIAADPDGLVTQARAELATSVKSDRQAREEAERHAADHEPDTRPGQYFKLRSPSAAADSPRLAHTLAARTRGWIASRLPAYSVMSVAFSPDGRLLASGGNERFLPSGGTKNIEPVRLWDPATGEQRRALTGHTGTVNGVAFSPDGRLLASGGDEPFFTADEGAGNADPVRELVQLFQPPTPVRLWDPVTGEQRRILTGHTGTVNGVAFSPDGRLLASCGLDKTVWLWDPATGEHRRTLTGHTGTVNRVAFSPDGRLLASCGRDRRLLLWDPATGEQRCTLSGRGGFCGVAFSPNGRQLASGNDDGMVRLWEFDPGP